MVLNANVPLTTQNSVAQALLNLNDLPHGWRVTEQTISDREGKVSYHRRDAFIKVGRNILQTIRVHDSYEEALGEYMQYKDGLLDEVELDVYDIQIDSEHSFINCTYIQVNPLVEKCTVYLVYNNIFMKLGSGIYEDDGFTFQDFHQLLLRADEKLKLVFPQST